MYLYSSPAKLNLFFRVLRKRSDGYHEIASLFQAIDLCDVLHISRVESDSLTCSDPDLLCDSSNLITKALRLFRNRFPFSYGIKIHLEKRIPMQAGLGGGSSNAATTLWALNEITGKPATREMLIQMGSQIGSDVPFFFSSGTAYCTGRGEILESFCLPHPLNGWLAKPPFGLSTAMVYKETRVEELPCRNPRQSLVEYPFFYNDLEPAAVRLDSRLQLFRKQLEEMGFKSVTMTGSGTAFFCLGKARSHFIPFYSIQRDENSWYP